MACNWTLGEHDLRALGCVGVFLTDNESVAETGARRGDLAVLDRVVTVRITANDTAWRRHLAARHELGSHGGVQDLVGAEPVPAASAVAAHAGARARLRSRGIPAALGPAAAERLQSGAGRAVRRRVAGRGPHRRDPRPHRVGAANPGHVADPVRRILRAAVRNRWAVLLQGPPGCGKTEITKQVVAEEIGRPPAYFSLPVTNVEDLCVPIPAPDGTLEVLLTRALLGPDPKVPVWDEYNRPKDKSAFARLMEVAQEWSLAGRPIPGLRAQVALQNPPYHLGRKLLVSSNNVAQASRFTVSYEVRPDDIPANQWLIDTYGEVAETVLEWWKNDIDDEGRQWVTRRTLERLIKLHRVGGPLKSGLIYLGDGEYAPIPLAQLRHRLSGRRSIGIRDLAAEVDAWEARLAAAAGHDEGTADSDTVHQILANAEVSQLREHIKVVARLLPHPAAEAARDVPGRSGEDKQRLWVDAFAMTAT
ncbi:AAA family ATPase [Nonomuraea sp. NPDC049695]|uniref:AAA family ATPase n=1 Tax=Nonomuraea sp. NPDC049695 TaxID=3154734 RepID=UPI00343AC643